LKGKKGVPAKKSSPPKVPKTEASAVKTESPTKKSIPAEKPAAVVNDDSPGKKKRKRNRNKKNKGGAAN
jgi:hypothetical protein